ncbi:farnesyl-diphosphate farnesyltransferase [Fibrobacterales bacterium]|nr:farnesyl-diphosphate farnesyltransferase [Fibrobacterales bacterium]
MENAAWEYAENALGKVSRTFALNIRVLGKKLQRPVLLAYLYMRMADTIEDEPSFEVEKKEKLLDEFAKIFSENLLNASGEPIKKFLEDLPASWRDSDNPEYNLCANAELVCPLLLEFPPAVVDSVRNGVAEMCGGMAEFVRLQNSMQFFTLETEHDLDRYCYFVAGLVGNMLTDLFYSASPFISAALYEKMRKLSVSFGLALQLVNIIKDIQEDAQRKVCFVPMEFCRKFGINSAEELFSENTPQTAKNAVVGLLIEKAKLHLNDAKNYIKLLPRVEYKSRLFCILPALMAVDNLRVIGNGTIIFEKDKRTKISRDTVKKIVRNATLFGWSNRWVERVFRFTR